MVERALERAAATVEMARVGMGQALGLVSSRSNDGAFTQSAESFRWTGTLGAGRILEVKGINGDVIVERTSGNEIEVTATARARRSDASEIRVDVVEHTGGVTICAVYPTPRGRRENYCATGSDGRMNSCDNDTQVEFRVRLPAGVSLTGRTVNGDLKALELASGVVLSTVNGDVDVSTTGYAEASTVNGSIDARIGRVNSEGCLSFETVNGSVTLDLPDDVDADLDARWVNGDLDSNLPLRIEGRVSPRRIQGDAG
jgi:DUF4097 and DUF4098 domain-containing protein YvlB